METSQSSPARETKRMMKLQDAMWKALGMKITWIEAAAIASMNVRNMQRMLRRYQKRRCENIPR